MQVSPLLTLHICSGTLALLSGSFAMSFRKGSRRHRLAGDIFVISMLGLGASGASMGYMRHETLNVAMGVLTCYLVVTAWMTARGSDGKTGILDLVALLVPLAVGAALVSNGIAAANSQTGVRGGVPAAPYFIFGSVALLFAAGDIRMLVHRGVSGTKRLARHLLRMCFALFIASGSLFLARPHLFPAVLRQAGIIFLLGILPLLLMIFWLIRVRFTKAFKRQWGSSLVHAQATQRVLVPGDSLANSRP